MSKVSFLSRRNCTGGRHLFQGSLGLDRQLALDSRHRLHQNALALASPMVMNHLRRTTSRAWLNWSSWSSWACQLRVVEQPWAAGTTSPVGIIFRPLRPPTWITDLAAAEAGHRRTMCVGQGHRGQGSALSLGLDVVRASSPPVPALCWCLCCTLSDDRIELKVEGEQYCQPASTRTVSSSTLGSISSEPSAPSSSTDQDVPITGMIEDFGHGRRDSVIRCLNCGRYKQWQADQRWWRVCH